MSQPPAAMTKRGVSPFVDNVRAYKKYASLELMFLPVLLYS